MTILITRAYIQIISQTQRSSMIYPSILTKVNLFRLSVLLVAVKARSFI